MYPETRLHEAFSKGQILSKLWICQEIEKNLLQKHLDNTLVLCGWYGTLSFLLFEKFGLDNFSRMRSIDIDKDCEKVGNNLNQTAKDTAGKYRSVTADAYLLDYASTKLILDGKEELTDFGCIINTSCEHLENFQSWYHSIPKGKLLILQTNDFFECAEHVNCVHSLEEFKTMAPMTDCFYAGALKLELYTRFMLIGYK